MASSGGVGSRAMPIFVDVPIDSDVEQRADARALAERPPQGQDRDAQQDADRADLLAGLPGDALVQRLPRPETEPGLDHQRDPETEQDQPDHERRDAWRRRAEVQPSGSRDGVGRGHARDDTPMDVRAVTMTAMQIHFLGGATTVTGSQFLLETERARVLIDCGMFQGSPNESVRNRIPFGFDPKSLDAVVLTHAHLDHCGLLPLLVKGGFAGPIHATAGTVELATLVLLDSGHLHEEFAKREARWEKRHPDEVEADDRKEADAYQAAVDLASAGGSEEEVAVETAGAPEGSVERPAAVATAVASSIGEQVETSVEPGATASLAARPRGGPARTAARARDRPRRPALHREGRRADAGALPAHRLRRGARGRARGLGHVPRCRPHPRVGDHPAASPGPRGRRGARHRLLGRPRPARDADPARPDRHDGRGLRPRRVDVRWPRTRAPGRGDPDPRRDHPSRGRGQWRAARAVVRDRPHPGGRVGARSPHRARRDPAAAAVPGLTDGVEGVGHLPAPPGLLRRADRRAAPFGRLRRSTTRSRSSPTTSRRRRRSSGRRART